MSFKIVYITALLFSILRFSNGQLPLPENCGTLYTFQVDEKAVPSIPMEDLLDRFNQYELKKSLTRKNNHLNMILWIKCNGDVEKIDAYQCQSFPECGYFLKDKKLKEHLYNCVSQYIKWTPGIYEGIKINSHIHIKTRIIKGKLEEIILD